MRELSLPTSTTAGLARLRPRAPRCGAASLLAVAARDDGGISSVGNTRSSAWHALGMGGWSGLAVMPRTAHGHTG